MKGGGHDQKKNLNRQRVRRIEGGFSYIPHRFLTDGFLEDLGQKELLLDLFLVLASDRYGLSYYAYDRICSMLKLKGMLTNLNGGQPPTPRDFTHYRHKHIKTRRKGPVQ